MSTSVLIVIIILLGAVSFFFRKKKNYPPGPLPWPIVGNLPLLRSLSRKFGGQDHALLELSCKYGSDLVALRVGSNDLIAVSGQEAIQQVLHNEEYDGRPWNEFINLRNFGHKNGITFNDGPNWREMRAWLVKNLRVLGLGRRQMLDLMTQELNDILEKIKDGGVRNLSKITAPAVINVLWTLTTGKKIDDTQRMLYFIDLMERRSQAFDMTGGILSALPWIKYIAPEKSGYNLLTQVNTEFKRFFMETIEEHKKNYTGKEQDDLINVFFKEMYSEANSDGLFNENELLIIMMDLFIAGITTTRTTLNFLFLNMIVNQDVQERLHQELDKVVGFGRSPDLNDRKRLPYTEAVLTESQRMCLVTPLIGPRRVLRETKLSGYTIPQESTMILNLTSIHMNPEYYSEPDIFKPERFLQNGVYVPDKNLILFGEGKRRCPGEILARCAIFLLFSGVMQRYRLLPDPGEEPPTLVCLPGLTISPKPYDALLIPRQAAPSSVDLPN
ncbi:probable cytochrome P450 305a1 [Neodiprion lecontei]|uniref:Probable cytochrome P450 305a1 n=1 Tax=Neodiprion lecontei TaxID=441921 RepID=A0ABM3FMR0_NEOLC|nr:probable cytochrome P450 305a1 [Neodiprion lecontei]